MPSLRRRAEAIRNDSELWIRVVVGHLFGSVQKRGFGHLTGLSRFTRHYPTKNSAPPKRDNRRLKNNIFMSVALAKDK